MMIQIKTNKKGQVCYYRNNNIMDTQSIRISKIEAENYLANGAEIWQGINMLIKKTIANKNELVVNFN